MNLQDIKAIQLGPRQMTFGFDSQSGNHQDLVISIVKELLEISGRASLDQIVDHALQEHGLSQMDTLQSVFWSAHELKVHFRANNSIIQPLDAKHFLLDNPEKKLEVVGNKVVEDSIFQESLVFYFGLFPGEKKESGSDQYQFSLSLLADLKEWKQQLESFRTLAQKPFYPGEELINEHLNSLATLLVKKDTFSLIIGFHHSRQIISVIADDVKTLLSFYSQHADFWAMLIQSMDMFQDTLGELRNNPKTSSAYDRLTQILASSQPYTLVDEARQLLPVLRAAHDRIIKEKIQKYRGDALLKVDAVIEDLSVLLNKKSADEDLCNQVLYPLRFEKKELQQSDTIAQIKQHLNHIKDMADDFSAEL